MSRSRGKLACWALANAVTWPALQTFRGLSLARAHRREHLSETFPQPRGVAAFARAGGALGRRRVVAKPFAAGRAIRLWRQRELLEPGRALCGDPYEFGTPPSLVFRTPGYPLVLAGLYLAYGDTPPVAAARALGAMLGAMAVLGTYLLAARLFDEARRCWLPRSWRFRRVRSA